MTLPEYIPTYITAFERAVEISLTTDAPIYLLRPKERGGDYKINDNVVQDLKDGYRLKFKLIRGHAN